MGASVVLLVALLAVVLRLAKTLRGPAPASVEQPAEKEPPVATETRVEQSAAPVGEPFEKDGRWWFERGTELLVYEAGTGEWAPASTEEPTAAAVDGVTEAEPTIDLEPAPEPAVVAPAHEGPADGTFWKCPSCGAVNGSVSATCRMCFAARP